MYRKFFLLSFCLCLLWMLLPTSSVAAVESDNGVVLEGNGIVTGSVALQGVARHPSFRKWQLDLLLYGEPASAVFLALGDEPQPELGVLATVDTTLYPDGDHLLRLRVVHSNLNYEENSTPITFANQGVARITEAGNVADMPATTVEALPAAADDPNGFQLADSTLQGQVDLPGVATHPTFRKWQIDLLVNRDPAQASFIAVGESAEPALTSLATLNTTLFPDGEHLLRLRVVHSNLNYEEYYTPVTFQNSSVQNSGVQNSDEQGVAEAVVPDVIQGLDLSAAPPDGVRWIEIDLSEQTLTAWQGDVAVMHTKVSTGRPATPTVLGRYQIRTKIPSQRMRGPGYDLPNVPSVMYFYAGYAIHGAYWHDNFGQTMSHGCVNMRLDEAAALYEWASIGDEVYVHE